MKANLKRVLSLLLVAVMLLSSFSGFGTLTAGAEQGAHFTLLNPDKHNYLHVTRTKDLQLDLYGRGGTVGAISWELVDANDNPLTGKLYSVSTSSAAQALNTSGDIITLDGAALKAALYPGEDFPTDGVKFTVHCYEAGNTVAGHTELTITLVDDHFYPVDDFPKPQRTHYLVGATHDDHGDLLYGDFRVWVRNADFPAGQVLDADITGVYTTAHHAPDGNTVSGDVFTFESVGDAVWGFKASQPGSTDFTVTFKAENGFTGNYTFTLNAAEYLFELEPRFAHGSTGVLRNGTLEFGVGAYCYFMNGKYQDCVELDDFTLKATTSATDPGIAISTFVNSDGHHRVSVTAGDNTDAIPLTLTATGEYNTVPFTIINTNHHVDVMDHYLLLEFEGLHVDVPVGDTITLFGQDGPVRYVEYSYDSNTGASRVDRTAETTWTVWADNGVFEVSADALPTITRVSADNTVLHIDAKYQYTYGGVTGTAHNWQDFGVSPFHVDDGNGGEGDFHIDYRFPGNRTEMSSADSVTHSVDSAYEFESSYPDIPSGMVDVEDVNVTNVTSANGKTISTVQKAINGWVIVLEAGFEGSYDVVLHYTDVLTGEDATHTYTVTVASENWNIRIDFDSFQLLPDDQHSFTAKPWVFVFDENGNQISGSTENCTINWLVPEDPPSSDPNIVLEDGVTFETDPEDPRTLIVTTDDLCMGGDYPVTAQVLVNDEVKAEASLIINVLGETGEYIIVTPKELTENELELGVPYTVTPVATRYYYDGYDVQSEPITDDKLTWTVSQSGALSVMVGDEEADSGTPYPANTAFTITRTGVQGSGMDFITGMYDGNQCGYVHLEMATAEFTARFNQFEYYLQLGEQMDPLNELVTTPADLLNYLPTIEWYVGNGAVAFIDENNILCTTNPGDTILRLEAAGIGTVAECIVRVEGPNDGNGGNSNDSIWWDADPDAEYSLYDTETLSMPLNISSITDENGNLPEGVTLTVEIGYCVDHPDGHREFVPLDDSILSVEEGTTFYTVDGKKLRQALLDEELITADTTEPFHFILRAAVYEGDELLAERDRPCMLRLTSVRYYFPGNTVNLVNATPADGPMETEYTYTLYSVEYPDGIDGTLTVTDIAINEVEGVSLVCEDDVWTMHIDGGFEGDIEVTLTYVSPLSGDPEEYTYTMSFVGELWDINLSVDNDLLLPGEERTVIADISRLMYNPENPDDTTGDISDATIEWEVTGFDGVSLEADGNTVTVKTTAETPCDRIITLTANLMVGDDCVGTAMLELFTRWDYFLFGPAQFTVPDYNETVTVTPTAARSWIDEDGAHQNKQLDETDTDYAWIVYWLDGLEITADGQPVQNAFDAIFEENFDALTFYPLGTEFTYKRTTFGQTGLAFDLVCPRVDENGEIQYSTFDSFEGIFDAIDIDIGFTSGSHELLPEKTVDMFTLLETDPDISEYLAGGTWSTDGSDAFVLYENGTLITKQPGEGVVYFNLYNEALGLNLSAECAITVLDPEGSDSGHLVHLGYPDYGYMYENQNQTLYLDATGIYTNDLELVLGVEILQKGMLVPLELVEGALTEVKDEESGRVIGVRANGEKLHKSLQQVLGTDYESYSVRLVAYAVDNGETIDSSAVDIDLCRARTYYGLDSGTTITDLEEQGFPLPKNLTGKMYRGNVDYADGDPDAYGTKITTEITSLTLVKPEGNSSDVRLEPTDKGWELVVSGGYLGEVVLEATYFDPLADDVISTRFSVTFVDEEYYLHLELEGREWSLLPGETRTYTAVINHFSFDPVEGVVNDNQLGSGATLNWVYDTTLPGVTYTVDGNTLTVATDAAAKDVKDGRINIYVEIVKDGKTLDDAEETLWVTNDYYTIDPDGFNESNMMELGDEVTFTPVLYHMQLDQEGVVHEDAVTAASGIQWVVQMPEEYASVCGLSVNGVTVQPGDTFPLGTTFTYTHRFTGGFDFALEAAFPGDDAKQAGYGFSINTAGDVELDIKSASYVLEPGDRLTLMSELVYAPSNLLEYLGNLSWSVSNTAVATVADGVLTANAAGTATVTLFSDLVNALRGESVGPLSFTVVVPVINDAHDEEEETKLPVVEENTPIDTEHIIPVEKPNTDDTDVTTQSAILAETKDLVEKLAGVLTADDDTAAEEVAAIIEPAADTSLEETVAALTTALETGAAIATKLNVVELDENDTDELPTENREKIEDVVVDKLGNAADAVFFDTTLQIHVGGTHVGNKTETKTPVKITITVPKELRDDNFRYTVFRLHGDSVEALGTKLDKETWTVTFESRLFSTYALGFSYDCANLDCDFSTYTPHTDATCTANATEIAVCGHGCGKEDIREVAGTKLGHSFVTYRDDNNATCTADGTKTSVCERGCGAKDVLTVSGTKLAHSFGAYTADGNATCKADGTKTAKCVYGCGTADTVADAGSKLEHKFTTYTADGNATCTKAGTKTAKCANGCGLTDTVADSTLAEHKFSEYVSNNDATCDFDGSMTAKCDFGCGTEDTVTDAGTKLEHSFTAYTENADGTKTASCDHGCGATDVLAAEESTPDSAPADSQTDAPADAEEKSSVGIIAAVAAAVVAVSALAIGLFLRKKKTPVA